MDLDDDDDDIIKSELLPIYQKGKEIFEVVCKIADLIPEDNEHLNEIKAWIFSDAVQLTVKVARAEAAGLYDLKMGNGVVPFDKDADDDIPFQGFDPEF